MEQEMLHKSEASVCCLLDDTPQKSNIDTKNGHCLRELPFPNHHFGYPC